MRYSGTTPSERQEMLREIGRKELAELFESIPDSARMKRPLDVRGPVPEAELLRELERMKTPPPRVSLVGAGLYHHYIPKSADSLVARSEWVTSYTPYQPELSQGTLVMYYEFQTYVCMLTGQEIANGGMYDGSTALAEAVLMAKRLRPKARTLLLSEGVNPEYRAVLGTYLRYQDIDVELLPLDPETGRTRVEVAASRQKDALAVVLQSPSFFGVIEDGAGVDPEAFRIAVVTEAQSLALLSPPEADITVGEMQSLGIPVQLGGPTSGFLATKKAHVRQLPGRLVGRTRDRHGNDAFCITLATREQFIRREKATSNICTSSGLMCLRSVVYLSLLGREGLQEVARMSARAARTLQEGLADVGLRRVHSGACFNEFTIDASARPGLYEDLRQRGFLLGVPLSRWFEDQPHRYLIAATELHYPVVAELIKEVKDRAHHS